MENLVLRSILIVAPEDMARCCQKYYRVAEVCPVLSRLLVCTPQWLTENSVQHSKAIQNYSAMRAIVSVLGSLRRFRMETSFIGPELERMSRFACTPQIRRSKAAGKPYLCPLCASRIYGQIHGDSLICLVADIFPANQYDFLDIVDDDHRIRWSMFKDLCHKVDEHVLQQDSPFLSHQPYSFREGQMADRVKKILLDVEPIDTQSQDLLATRRYQDANRARTLFHRRNYP